MPGVMKPNKNLDLQKVAFPSGFLSHPSTADRLLKFLGQLLILALWKSVVAISAPFGRIFAMYFWLGKSVYTLTLALERQVLKTVGWMSGLAFTREDRIGRLMRHYFATDIRRWHVGLAVLLVTGVVSTIVQKVRESLDVRVQRRKHYKRLMDNASSYEHWRELATQLSKLEAQDGGPGRKQEDRLYDRKLLQEKTHHLKRTRATGNEKEIMFALRIDLIRNIANIAKSRLHDRYAEIPEPIQKYLREVKDQLFALCDWPETELPFNAKKDFFSETRHTFGRTALLLSGGGGLGTFHIGVCKALFERRLLPRVLAGSSVGSIVSAIIATRTDMELRDLFSKLDQFDIGFFNNSRAVELVHHLINKGSLQDMAFMIKKLRALLGDCTFLEAFQRTGRVLNVTVCPADTNEPPRLLNYLTAPYALIWSAVAASSAFPGLFPAQHLLARNSNGDIVKFSAQSGNDSMERRWRDGSLELDLPVQALSEMFNCNHYLVSQTNPHIVPLLNIKKCLSPKLANILEAELKHRCQVAQWLLPDWFPSKWLTLFTQPWEGDITMTLPSALWNLGKTIINPTTEELMRSVKVGEVATWEKLAAIECNCTIEATLDKCMAKLANRERQQPIVQNMGHRIPSWLHMPSIGMQSVASWGENIDGALDQQQNGSWGDADLADSAMDVPVFHPHPHPQASSAAATLARKSLTMNNMSKLETIPSMRSLPHVRASSKNLGSFALRDDQHDTLDDASSSSDRSSHSSPGGSPSQSFGGSSSGFMLKNGTKMNDSDFIALAQMDCTDATAGDLWSDLLPVAGQCISVTERAAAAAAAENSNDGAIDVFAY